MITAFDRIFIEVAALGPAAAEYAALLGPFEMLDGCARLTLANTCIELRERAGVERAQIHGLSLFDADLCDGREEILQPDNRGLHLSRSGSRSRSRPSVTATGIFAVDHIVLQSADADDCIRLFGKEGLGMRLALDQLVPEWGGRMVFFRLGKMTLEVIQNLKQAPAQDYFWGITYLCDDLNKTVTALDERGVAHSAVRKGRKPGTIVATVKSHCLGLPTLLLGPEKL